MMLTPRTYRLAGRLHADQKHRGIWVRDCRHLECEYEHANTAAKRLRMRQVEHFRSLFQSHFPVRSSLPRTLGFILCATCGSVLLLHVTSCFDYFVVIEISFMDNQAQITETISRLDSEKVR